MSQNRWGKKGDAALCLESETAALRLFGPRAKARDGHTALLCRLRVVALRIITLREEARRRRAATRRRGRRMMMMKMMMKMMRQNR